MAAFAHQNVIRFPETARDPATTLRAAGNLLAEKLREALNALAPEIDEEMLTRGDLADEQELRNLYYGAHDALLRHRARLPGELTSQWLRLLAEAGQGTPRAAPGVGPDELQLVELSAVDEDLAVKAIAAGLKEVCEDELFALGRRLAFLTGRGEEPLPVADLLAEALRGALAEAGIPGPARLELLRAARHHTVVCLGPVLQAGNAYLVGRHVLPGLRRSYRRTAGNAAKAGRDGKAADGSNVLALLQRLVAGSDTAVWPARAWPGMAAAGAGPSGSMVAMAAAMERILGALDSLQRTLPPVDAAMPATRVLREFRASEVGRNLDHLDAVTADIVATLFDFIFDDSAIADPIKALIGRLQIPVLKVAMLDKSFFSSKAHPARRLLDGISRAAARCGPAAGRDDPLTGRVAAIVERLQREFRQDTGLFDTLCAELDAFLDGQEAAADERAARAAPLVAVQEERELAALAADQALAGWLAMPLPGVVSELLAREWRGLLARHHLAGDSAAWAAAVDLVAELVASVQPQPEPARRRRLATSLPGLVRRIHEGLDCAQAPAERRLALLDGLFSLHAAVLRGGAPEADEPAAAGEPELACELVHEEGTRLEHISLVRATPLPVAAGGGDAADQVAKLARGDWVEFRAAEGFERHRLAWISPQRGILLFTNPHSPRALSIAPAALAVKLERGDAAIVPAEPIFERAVSRALEGLQAA